MTQLARYGMPGVWTHAYVDAWSPGYVAEMATDHNGLMRFYEIFGNAGATTMERTIYQSNPAITGEVAADSATSPSASGTVLTRPMSTSSGPCATTPTTRKLAPSPRSSSSPAFPN